MSNIKEYKCKECGGNVVFSSDTQSLKCTFCGKEYDANEFNEQNNGLTQLETNNKQTNEVDENLRSYICQSCGGEIVVDETLGATKCPFCGNNVVINETFNHVFRPDLVIPFKISKEQVSDIFKQSLKGKFLLPKMFKEMNYIEEVKGVYVPFWIYDAKSATEYDATGVRLRHYSTSNYNVTERHYYNIQRKCVLDFDNVPVDGSKTIDNTMMESLEPFDIKDAVPYEPHYLSGYYANKYDETKEDCKQRAEERMKNSSKEIVRKSANNYNELQNEHFYITFSKEKIEYVLYPVYLITSSYNNETYLFAVNGQTGKFVGNLPIDKGKNLLLTIGVFVVSSVIALLGLGFIGGML